MSMLFIALLIHPVNAWLSREAKIFHSTLHYDFETAFRVTWSKSRSASTCFFSWVNKHGGNFKVCNIKWTQQLFFKVKICLTPTKKIFPGTISDIFCKTISFFQWQRATIQFGAEIHWAVLLYIYICAVWNGDQKMLRCKMMTCTTHEGMAHKDLPLWPYLSVSCQNYGNFSRFHGWNSLPHLCMVMFICWLQ